MLIGKDCKKIILIMLPVIVFVLGHSAFGATTPDTSQIKLIAKSKGDSLQSAFQQLEVIRQKNDVLKQQLKTLQDATKNEFSELTPKDITTKKLDKAELKLSVANANLDGANLAKAEAQQVVDSTLVKINNIENELQSITLAAGKTSAVRLRIADLQSQLNFEKAALRSQQKLVQALTTMQQIYQDIYNLRVKRKSQLEKLYNIHQKQLSLQETQKIELALQERQKDELDKLIALNAKVKQLDPSAEDYAQHKQHLEIKMLKAQETSNLIHMQTVLLRQKVQLQSLLSKDIKNASASDLNSYISSAEAIQNEIASINDLIKRKIQLLGRHLSLTKKRHKADTITNDQYQYQSQAIVTLLNRYQDLITKSQALQKKVKQAKDACQAELTQALSRRQGLPGLNITEWRYFLQDILKMPIMGLQAIMALKDQLVFSLVKLNKFSILSIIIVEILWLWIWLMLRGMLGKISAGLSDKRQNISNNTLYITLQLIQRNLLGIFVVAGISILFWLTGLPIKSFAPLIYLAIVWFVFKFAIGLSRLILLENVGDASGRDVTLYNELKWALLVGGILTMLTVLAHQLPVSYQVTEFFNRLFMLFMLIISILLLRSWQVAPALVQPYIDGARPYLIKVVKLLSFLIPLTIFSTALIGLCGYVDLAWAISRYEGIFLLVMSGYILARGFLKDILEWISELFIRKLKNGWLWTQAILRPLDRVLRVLLFLSAGVVLFIFYGWDRNSKVVKKLVEILHSHIVDAKGLIITPISIIELIIAATIVYWLSRWTREFAYRWLFAKTRDLGLRNSLSVLTQYTMFMISIFIALKIIGIDLSGISYVLAGFAAGVGLGLRDLIKNYASGLLLLFERPIRAGDLVTIGNCEGEVTHIGMRAVTVKTWDHMEVLVPNSETFEKPFTNWTHLDSIVRTVIDLKVAPNDNPFFVQDLILKTLEDIPDIVSDPAPQVYFKEMNEALLFFEVRYYINLQLGLSRAKVRSEVLFTIFKVLSENGIKPPHPPQDVYLHKLDNENE